MLKLINAGEKTRAPVCTHTAVLIARSLENLILHCEPIHLIKGSMDLLLGEEASETIRRLGRERKRTFFLRDERKHYRGEDSEYNGFEDGEIQG